MRRASCLVVVDVQRFAGERSKETASEHFCGRAAAGSTEMSRKLETATATMALCATTRRDALVAWIRGRDPRRTGVTSLPRLCNV